MPGIPGLNPGLLLHARQTPSLLSPGSNPRPLLLTRSGSGSAVTRVFVLAVWEVLHC